MDAGDQDARIISWRRVAVSFAAGTAAAVAVVLLGAAELTVLVGWAVAVTILLVWVWRISWPQDERGTKRLAEEEGRSHVMDTVVLVAAVASLAAVLAGVVTAGRQDAVAVAGVVLAVVDAILSWALVNTVFALKYARLYFEGNDGGIEFPRNDHPVYADFAYLAFTVGMSFAVSDTGLETTRIRTVGLGHALLSYLFGSVLIAVAVSLLTNV
ncbi:DUF1345 domain-containing protein [Pseudonocardia oroxyli]|uniref:Uncharacterized membrane protein n=1 Tax=Pseudonocardia oroxyli TaxID=366584 RepID=A0A1G7SJS9_PSEOR|nr:DUF1345 domain-containing protein [Pseudonocardia oroxyli]SDG23221.1 Uncharacterized membrane protein [Pseudonocardia oroxyli]